MPETDPVQVAAVARLRAEEPAEPDELSREVLTEPAELVELLTWLADRHGMPLDRSTGSRRAALLAARMLQHTIVPLTEDGESA